jgi:putative ABC transport system permease protein
MTMHKVSIIQPLPEAYLNRIRGIDGVRQAAPFDWFGGIYQNERNPLPVMATDPESFLEVYADYRLPQEQRRAWIADRGSAIISPSLAERFGWKIGDTIPMRSNIWQKQDRSNTWDMKIAGIYQASNGDSSVYFHHEYLNESRSVGRDTVGWVALRIGDPQRAAEIAGRIDAQFANSSTETKTATEKAFAQSFANQLGNIGAIVTAVVTAVFFTMLLVTANSMAQSVRERTPARSG